MAVVSSGKATRFAVVLALVLLTAAAVVVVRWPWTAGPTWTPSEPEVEQAHRRTPDHLRVLFVGNSFTFFNGGQAKLLRDLAAADKSARPVWSGMVALAGHSLEDHWRNGRALRAIRSGNWDYVVLQERSDGAIEDPESFMAHAHLFDGEIRAIGARTVIFGTWAVRDDQTWQALIDARYRQAAGEMGAILAPVADAWRLARQRRPELSLYLADGRHPSAAGSYLAACVFYAMLSERSPVGLGYRGEADEESRAVLSAEDAAFLQHVAQETVEAMRLQRGGRP